AVHQRAEAVTRAAGTADQSGDRHASAVRLSARPPRRGRRDRWCSDLFEPLFGVSRARLGEMPGAGIAERRDVTDVVFADDGAFHLADKTELDWAFVDVDLIGIQDLFG